MQTKPGRGNHWICRGGHRYPQNSKQISADIKKANHKAVRRENTINRMERDAIKLTGKILAFPCMTHAALCKWWLCLPIFWPDGTEKAVISI